MNKYLIIVIFFLGTTNCFSQSIFKIVPKPPVAAAAAATAETPIIKRVWRPTVVLPALKLVQSTRPESQLDGLLSPSTGGGISFQKLAFNSDTNKWESLISFSPATILLTGNLTADNPIDLSYVANVAFFNNLIAVGVGYDFGNVGDRSRLFFGINLGISLNN